MRRGLKALIPWPSRRSHLVLATASHTLHRECRRNAPAVAPHSPRGPSSGAYVLLSGLEPDAGRNPVGPLRSGTWPFGPPGHAPGSPALPCPGGGSLLAVPVTSPVCVRPGQRQSRALWSRTARAPPLVAVTRTLPWLSRPCQAVLAGFLRVTIAQLLRQAGGAGSCTTCVQAKKHFRSRRAGT